MCGWSVVGALLRSFRLDRARAFFSGRQRVRGLLALGLAAGCGALLPLTLAPFGWWPLGILSIGGWFWLLDARPRNAAALGFAYGIGKFGVGVSWVYVSMRLYGGASVPLAGFLVLLFVAGLSLFTLSQGWLYGRVAAGRSPLPAAALFAAVWLLFEWLLTWFLTGFPWLFPGYAHLDTPLVHLLPVGGVSLASLGVVVTSVFLTAALARIRHQLPAADADALALRGRAPSSRFDVLSSTPASSSGPRDQAGRRLDALTTKVGDGCGLAGVPALSLRGRVTALLLASMPWVTGLALSSVEWVRPASSHTAALVQGNVDQAVKWQAENRQRIVDLYLELTEPYWGHDLVVWPEAAVTLFEQQAGEILAGLDARGERSGTALVLGIPTAERTPGGGWDIYNSALATGAGSGRYSKRRLVPFGDYVPFEAALRGLIGFFDLPMSAFRPGARQQGSLDAGVGRAAVGICYEIAYGELMRVSARQAGLLLTITNDTWFGASIGPLQHMQIARSRAVENGRWLLRGSNNGVTAIVDHRGRVRRTLPQFERGVLTGEFRIMEGHTPYNRHGDAWLVVLCLAGLIRGWIRAHAPTNE